MGGRPAGIVLTPAWIDAPERLVALPVRATGWVGALAFLIVIATLGAALLAGGGVLYTAGAGHLSQQAPGPRLGCLGYRDIFHVLVIAAAALQYAAIAFFVLPRARG